MPESTRSDKNAIENGAGPDKIFKRSSRVRINTVCHLTLTVLTPFSCNPGKVNAVDVVLVLTAL